MDNRKRTLTLIKCCICAGGALGIINNCMGIYFSSIAQSLGVGVGRVSILVTVMSLAMAFSNPLLMRLIRRNIPINYLMSGGVVLTVLAYLIMSFGKNSWFFYVAGLILGIGMCSFANLPITLILRDWYGEKMGTVTGIVMGFGGVFGAIFNPIFSSFITNLGWNNSFRIQALILLVLVLPCAFFLSMNPYKEKEETNEEEITETIEKAPATKVTKKVFVMLVILAVLLSFQGGMASHFSAFGVDVGYSLQFTAMMVSAMMVANVVFKLVHGAVADATTPYHSNMLFSGVGLLGSLLIFLFYTSGTILLISSFLYGSYYSIGSLGFTLLVQYIAKEEYGEVFARISIFSSIAFALSLSVFGMMRDVTGTYLPSLALSMVASVCVIIMIYILKKTVK